MSPGPGAAPIDAARGAFGADLRPIWSSAILVFAVCAVFAAVRGHAFLTWDDNINVTENALVRSTDGASWSRIWSAPYASLYVPLSYSAWRVLAMISGPIGADGRAAVDPVVFHLANLTLHVVNAWLVLRILRRMLRHELGALCGALLFALHPLQVESVAWVSELRGLLASCLGFAALDRHLAAALAGTRAARLRAHGIALVAFTLALLAKPTAVAVPLVAIVIDAVWFDRPWRKWAAPVAIGGALALLAVVLASDAQSERLGFVASLPQRPRIASDSVAFYLGKLVWPFGLAADYGRTPMRVLEEGDLGLAFVPWIVLAVVLFARERRRMLACFALFVVALLPVLGFVPFAYQKIAGVADRYAYVAMLGPAAALGLALARSRGRMFAVSSLAVVALLGFRAWDRTRNWRDSQSLFEATLRVNPRSFKAWNHVGLAQAAEGRTRDAIASFEKSVALQPEHQAAQYNLGSSLQQVGRVDEALPHLEAAVSLKPLDPAARMALGSAYLVKRRAADAREQLQRALELEPSDGRLHGMIATTYLLEQKLDDAERELVLALAFAETAELQRTLGAVLLAQGRHAEAAEHLRAALRLRADWAEPMEELAAILVSTPDVAVKNVEEGLRLALRAVESSGGRGMRALEVLASAHAAAGHPREAVEAEERALARAKEVAPDRVSVIEAALKAYRDAAAVAPPSEAR